MPMIAHEKRERCRLAHRSPRAQPRPCTASAAHNSARSFGLALDVAAVRGLIQRVSWLDGRCRIAGDCGPLSNTGGGKSGLHVDTVAANGRRGRPQGKCHRKQTAFGSPEVRVKGCGKSAPRGRRRSWQGKPHREQDQIGVAGRTETWRQVRLQTRHPGWLLEAPSNGCPRRMAVAEAQASRQNPAYRPADNSFSLSALAVAGALRSNNRSRWPVSGQGEITYSFAAL